MGKEDEIRLIAYNIWEQESCCDGQDCEHWIRAEAIWGKNRSKEMSPSNQSGIKASYQIKQKNTIVSKSPVRS